MLIKYEMNDQLDSMQLEQVQVQKPSVAFMYQQLCLMHF